MLGFTSTLVPRGYVTVLFLHLACDLLPDIALNIDRKVQEALKVEVEYTREILKLFHHFTKEEPNTQEINIIQGPYFSGGMV